MSEVLDSGADEFPPELFQLAAHSDRAFAKGQREALALELLVSELRGEDLPAERRELNDLATALNLADDILARYADIDVDYLRALQEPSVPVEEVISLARQAQSALNDYVQALRAIPRPENIELAAALSDMITGWSQVAVSYGTAIDGFETGDVALLDQADSELAAGLDKLAQAAIRLTNEAAAVRERSLNPLLYS